MRWRIIQVVQWAIEQEIPVSIFNHLRTLPADPPELRQALECKGKTFNDDWFRPDASGPHNRGVRIKNEKDWRTADTLLYMGMSIDECVGVRTMGYINAPKDKRKIIIVDATTIQACVARSYYYWPDYLAEHRLPQGYEDLWWDSAEELERERDYFAANYASQYAEIMTADMLTGAQND